MDQTDVSGVSTDRTEVSKPGRHLDRIQTDVSDVSTNRTEVSKPGRHLHQLVRPDNQD